MFDLENKKSDVDGKDHDFLPNKEYVTLVADLKKRVQESQVKAFVSVNKELIKLYWEIGKAIIEKQKESSWGSKFVDRLAKDLRSMFPEMQGFSLRNVRYMVKFAREYPEFSIVQQVAAQLPWGHNMLILDKLGEIEARVWYGEKTLENGWSRSVLSHWIDSNLYERQGKGISNFKDTLIAPQSDLAREMLKDPFCFDFVALRKDFDERELENGLLDHIQKFLLELGAGFAFVGRQVHLEIGGQDFYVDLLFYHLKLRCYIVIELKATEFNPEYSGKVNFYLTAVDKLLKAPDDKPTIGMILCKTKNKIVAEYALQDIRKPIGISEYETKIIESLPDNLKSSLPTIEEIEEELCQRL